MANLVENIANQLKKLGTRKKDGVETETTSLKYIHIDSVTKKPLHIISNYDFETIIEPNATETDIEKAKLLLSEIKLSPASSGKYVGMTSPEGNYQGVHLLTGIPLAGGEAPSNEFIRTDVLFYLRQLAGWTDPSGRFLMEGKSVESQLKGNEEKITALFVETVMKKKKKRNPYAPPPRRGQ